MIKILTNFTAKKIHIFFYQKLQFTFPYASIKDAQAVGELQNMICLFFSLLLAILWVIFSLPDLDPDLAKP